MLTGVTDEKLLGQFFQKAGIPAQPVIQGGKIVNYRIERIWVEAFIPYGNYRGAALNDTDEQWIPMDTAIKAAGYTYSTPPAYLDDVDLTGFRGEYLQGDQSQTPLYTK